MKTGRFTKQTNHQKSYLPGCFIPLLDSFYAIGHGGSRGVFTPAALDERFHIYSVPKEAPLTIGDVVGKSRPQPINYTLVKLDMTMPSKRNHLHILTREITGITVANNAGKDFGNDTTERKHVHLIIRLHTAKQLRSLSTHRSRGSSLHQRCSPVGEDNTALWEESGEPEVGDLDMSVLHKEIVQLRGKRKEKRTLISRWM